MNPRNRPQFTLGFPNEGSVEDGASGSGFFLDEITPIVNNYFYFYFPSTRTKHTGLLLPNTSQCVLQPHSKTFQSHLLKYKL